MKTNFGLLFLIFIIPLALIVFFIVNRFWGGEVLESFIIGFVLMSFVTFLSVFVTNKTFNKSFNIFWGFLAGSFFVRMIILIGSAYYFLKYTGIHVTGYIISLILFYFSLLIIEIIYYNYSLVSIKDVKETLNSKG